MSKGIEPPGRGITLSLYFCRTVASIQNVGPVVSSWSVLDSVACHHAVTRAAKLLGRDSLQSIKLQQLQNPSHAVIFIMSFRVSTHAGPPFQIAFYWFRLRARSITHARIATTLMLSEWYWSRRLEKHPATLRYGGGMIPSRSRTSGGMHIILSENTKERPWRKWKESMTIQRSPTRISYFQSQSRSLKRSI